MITIQKGWIICADRKFIGQSGKNSVQLSRIQIIELDAVGRNFKCIWMRKKAILQGFIFVLQGDEINEYYAWQRLRPKWQKLYLHNTHIHGHFGELKIKPFLV